MNREDIALVRLAAPAGVSCPCRIRGCSGGALRELRVEVEGETLAVRLCPKHLRMLRDVIDGRVW